MSKKPGKRPGGAPASGNPFERLMREIVERPEGPAALSVMAHMERALKPAGDAIARLVKAIAADIQTPTEETAEDVARAKLAYELLTGNEATGELWDGFVNDARKMIEQERRRPPAIESILSLPSPVSDLEYEIAHTLGGLRGTWHRLWSSISSERFFSGQGVEIPSVVPEIRAEFEDKLGRAINPEEWERLMTHAHKHCDEVLKPAMSQLGKKGP